MFVSAGSLQFSINTSKALRSAHQSPLGQGSLPAGAVCRTAAWCLIGCAGAYGGVGLVRHADGEASLTDWLFHPLPEMRVLSAAQQGHGRGRGKGGGCWQRERERERERDGEPVRSMEGGRQCVCTAMSY